ncbi:methionyl-tRNA formyltransferase [Rhodococcus sp. LBL1]|nr:methionyl-tRNA formyltransferase [Rhodococcus sp. LBL1]MDH6682002.1 methionyl-tRNA formyltransferase [Rhodococcus sp. LBL2]
MTVVTLGYQTWGHRTLQAFLDSDHEVVLAVSHPKSDHAYEKMWADSVADNGRTWLPRDVFDAPRYGTFNIHDSADSQAGIGSERT